MPNSKKKTNRSKQKYPSLTRKYNSRVRQEYLDYDYIDQLSDEEKQFLEDFNKEYYEARVGKQKDAGKKNRFTKGKKAVKEAQSNNNKRNSDLYGKIKNKVASTKLLNYDDVLNLVEDNMNKDVNSDYIEDAIIEYLDHNKDLNNGPNNSSNNS